MFGMFRYTVCCHLSLVLTPRDCHENDTDFIDKKSKPQKGRRSFRFTVERARIQGQKTQACSDTLSLRSLFIMSPPKQMAHSDPCLTLCDPLRSHHRP